jgi:hypothetical protein
MISKLLLRYRSITEKWIIAELRFWKFFYQRKDQDPKAYAEYINAESHLASQ